MNEKTTKHAFVSGVMVRLNGKIYTRPYTKKEEEMLKNAPIRTKEELETMDKRIMERLKLESPDFYNKLYGEKE